MITLDNNFDQFEDLMGATIETEDKWLNKKLNSNICYFGGGGGGGNQQQDVPPTLRPYVTEVLERASGEYGPGVKYQAYPGDPIVGFTPLEQAAQQGIYEQAGLRGLAATAPGLTSSAAYYAPAYGLLGDVRGTMGEQARLAGASEAALSGTPVDIARQQRAIEEGRQRFLTQEQMIGATTPLLSDAERQLGLSGRLAREAGMTQRGAARAITPEESRAFGLTGQDIQQYMDPYQQQVIDIEKRQARQDAAQTAQAIAAKAAGMGAFGGSRQAILEGQAASDLGTRLADIQARGQQAAYQQALQTAAQQQQVGLAQAAQQRQREAGLGSALAGLGQQQQQLGIGGYGALAQQGLGTAQAIGGVGQQLAGLGGQFGNVASTRAGLAQALGGVGQQFGGVAQGLGALSGQYGTLGQQALGQGYRELGYISGIGEAQRGQQQQRADYAYEEFKRQRDFPTEQLQKYSSLIQGFPFQFNMPGAQPTAFQQGVGGVLAASSLGKNLGFFKEGGDVGKKKLTDLSGDGKITQKDVLIGRGVIEAKGGGGLKTVYRQSGKKIGPDVGTYSIADAIRYISETRFDRAKREEQLEMQREQAVADALAAGAMGVLGADPSAGGLAALTAGAAAASPALAAKRKADIEEKGLDREQRQADIEDFLTIEKLRGLEADRLAEAGDPDAMLMNTAARQHVNSVLGSVGYTLGEDGSIMYQGKALRQEDVDPAVAKFLTDAGSKYVQLYKSRNLDAFYDEIYNLPSLQKFYKNKNTGP